MQALDFELQRAANALSEADALFIGAGAGMGVDSGLPDFRGREGFWRAYPPFARLGLNFADVANPRWFHRDPGLAWGFYGHRLHLYRQTMPHAGFEILRQWAATRPHGAFVYTSNVDGHFQKAGFDSGRLVECHGSIHRLQCLARCGVDPFPSDPFEIKVDPDTFRAAEPWPVCPSCGGLARPNILMFGDFDWESSSTDAQNERLNTWLRSIGKARLLTIDLGAGLGVPTVRFVCEEVTSRLGGLLIRINPRDHQTPRNQISLPLGALEALSAMDRRLAAGSARPVQEPRTSPEVS